MRFAPHSDEMRNRSSKSGVTIYEYEQALGRRGARGSYRGTDRRLYRRYERAVDDVHRSARSVPSRIPDWSVCQSGGASVARTRADEWLNSPPLTPEALRGKVVLVNFWTYTCINWRRQLPYVRAWAEKYKDQGLVVIGVHAPEFEFEKNIDNVRWAVNDMKIDYPVAVDNNHAIWRAFRNQAWPALYFIDAQGRLRHHFFGEGSYEQSEMVIQALLREAGATGISREPVKVNARGHDAAPDWANLKSPENYVGFERTENFARQAACCGTSPACISGPRG